MREAQKAAAELCHWRESAQSVGQSDGHGWAQETISLRARISEQEGQIDRADEHTAKIMKALEVAEAERDAAYVRGLERARQIADEIELMVRDFGIASAIESAIQAEIDKTKAGK